MHYYIVYFQQNSPNQFASLKDSLTIDDVASIDVGCKVRTVTWSPDTQFSDEESVLRCVCDYVCLCAYLCVCDLSPHCACLI